MLSVEKKIIAFIWKVLLGICLLLIFLQPLNAETKVKFLLSTLKEVFIYQSPDTLEYIGSLPTNTVVELQEIKRDNEWVKIKYRNTVGWIKARYVKFEVKSFVKGYKLTSTSPTVSPEEFKKRAGIPWEQVEKQSFTKSEEAIEFGNSLVKKGLLDKNPATYYHFQIWTIFKEGYPNLHILWSGGIDAIGDPYAAKCPVCNKVLSKCCEPHKYVSRLSDFTEYKDSRLLKTRNIILSDLEIYQCINGHLIAVEKIAID